MHRRYCSEVLYHLGLVAGMLDALGMGDVLDRAIQHTPATRLGTVGSAVKAMVLNGLGFVHQQLSLVPMFFQNKPTPRLIAPGIEAQHLHDDTLGRALDMLYDSGVTEFYRLIAATAAQRLDRTSFHGDGRSKSAEEPEAQVVHITRGSSCDHRPDLNQVMLALLVEHQAGIPLLMQPLSDHSNDGQPFGQVVTEPITQLQTTYGTTSRVADSALSRADNLQKLVETGWQWIPRVPATVREAQDALAQADPETMEPLGEGYRSHLLPSTYGGVAQRWMLCASVPRRPQAQRSVDQYWRKQSEADAKALQKLCRTPFACAVDAQQALATLAQGLQAAALHEGTLQPRRRHGKRGRPGQDAPPPQVGDPTTGALTSSLAAHAALVAPQRCCLLATNALDAHL